MEVKEGQPVVVKGATGVVKTAVGGLYQVETPNGRKVIVGADSLRAPRPDWWPLQKGDQVVDETGVRWYFREVEMAPGKAIWRLVRNSTPNAYIMRTPKVFLEEHPKAYLYMRNGLYA